jgi:uncharacterized protein (DUF58 family)
MKTFFSAIVAVAALTTAACAQNTKAPASPGPKFEVIGGETYDWGKVKAPKEGFLEATIRMRNAGESGVLKLVEIRPGCGCTKTDPDKTELNAGEVSTMNVKLNISPSQNGPLSKNITVRSTDGKDTATHYLILKADIVRALSMSQPYFAFSDLKVGSESTSTIKITNNETVPIKVSEVLADGMAVNLAKGKVIKPDESLEVVARVTPSKSGQFTGKLSFKTDHPDHTVVDVQAYGMVVESKSAVFQKDAK